jgi:hypothetical protein
MLVASMKAISSLFILHLLILAFGITGYGWHNTNACCGLLRLFRFCSVIELTGHSKYLNMGRICSTHTMDTPNWIGHQASAFRHMSANHEVFTAARSKMGSEAGNVFFSAPWGTLAW